MKGWRCLSQMTINFGVDEIYTLSSGLQIDKTSTSPAESPSATDEDTWSDGDEEDEIAHDLVAAGSGTFNSRSNLALTHVQAAITKGWGCLEFNHMSAFNATD